MSSQEIPTTRQERRKERTRTSLLDATRALMGRRGLDAITIADIAAEADVGVGTFYNHFATKEEIVQRAADREFGRADLIVGDAVVGEQDPAVRLALGVLVSLRELEPNLLWAGVASRSREDREEQRPLLNSPLVVRLLADLAEGYESGSFDVAPQIGGFLVVGCVNSSLMSRAAGILQPEDDSLVAIAALRALGVTTAQARKATTNARTLLGRE
jgi:AcrR family transcriptional regulator